MNFSPVSQLAPPLRLFWHSNKNSFTKKYIEAFNSSSLPNRITTFKFCRKLGGFPSKDLLKFTFFLVLRTGQQNVFFDLLSNLKTSTQPHTETQTEAVLQRPCLKVGPREGVHAAKHHAAIHLPDAEISPVVSTVGGKKYVSCYE